MSVSSSGLEPDDGSFFPSISADGRCVALAGLATNFVANDTNLTSDAFIHDVGPIAPVPSCFGDGSAVPCPCGISGSQCSGCENSSGTGGTVLAGSGVASLSSDTLRPVCWGEAPAAASVFLQGSETSSAARLEDSLRCLAGSARRLYLETASPGMASAPQSSEPRISERSAALGDAIPLGATRYYQVLYRDPSPSFCPSPTGGTWNLTSGIATVWSP